MKISIITASFNRKEFIGAAIESVLAQNYSDFEHWIIDGGSSDGTLEFLQQYPHLKVHSEPDHGVYDAWNKGIERVTGDLITILNTDDVYAPGAFHSCAKIVAASPSVPVVIGRLSNLSNWASRRRDRDASISRSEAIPAFFAECHRRTTDHQQPVFPAFAFRRNWPF